MLVHSLVSMMAALAVIAATGCVTPESSDNEHESGSQASTVNDHLAYGGLAHFVADQTLTLTRGAERQVVKAQVASDEIALQVVFMEPKLLMPIVMLRGERGGEFKFEVLKEGVLPEHIEWRRVFDSINSFYAEVIPRDGADAGDFAVPKEFVLGQVRYRVLSKMVQEGCPVFPQEFSLEPLSGDVMSISASTDAIYCGANR